MSHQLSQQRMYQSTRKLPFQEEDDDYMDMTPKHVISSSHSNHNSSVYHHSNSLPQNHANFAPESEYADMRRGNPVMPVRQTVEQQDSDYADMTSFKSEFRGRGATTGSVLPNSGIYSPNRKNGGIASPSIQNERHRSASSPRFYEPQAESIDCVDSAPPARNPAVHNPLHMLTKIREGSFNKDDDNDYEEMETTNKRPFSSNHSTNSPLNSKRYVPVSGNYNQDDSFQSPERFRTRCSGMSYSKPRSPTQELLVANQPNSTNTATAAGKAARKYLQMGATVDRDSKPFNETKLSSPSLVRSTSRVSTKSGGVQNRISKARQNQTYKSDSRLDKVSSQPPIQQTQSLQLLNVPAKALKTKQTKKSTSISDEEDFFNNADGSERAESFHKSINKGKDGSSIMKFLSDGKRSQSLDKNYIEWLRKTTPFATRNPSTNSNGTDPGSSTGSPSHIDKMKSLDSVRSYKSDRSAFPDDDDDAFQEYIASIPTKGRSIKISTSEEQKEGFLEGKDGNLKKKEKKGKHSSSRKPLESDEGKHHSLSGKFKRTKMSLRFTKKKNKTKEKLFEKVNPLPGSDFIESNSEQIIDASGNDADSQDQLNIVQSPGHRNSIIPRNANTLMPIVKPPLGLSPQKLTGVSSSVQNRSRASSSSSTTNFSKKSNTLEREVLAIPQKTGHRRNKSDMTNSRNCSSKGTLSNSTPALNEPDLDISLASNYDDDDVENILTQMPSKHKFTNKSNTLGRFFSRKSKPRKSLDSIVLPSSPERRHGGEFATKHKPTKSFSLEGHEMKEKLQIVPGVYIGSPLTASKAYMLQANLVHGLVTKRIQTTADYSHVGSKKGSRGNKYATMNSLYSNTQRSLPKKSRNNWIPELDSHFNATWDRRNIGNFGSSNNLSTEVESTTDTRDVELSEGNNQLKPMGVIEDSTNKGLTVRRSKRRVLPLYKSPSSHSLEVARVLYNCIKESQPGVLREDLDDDELTDSVGENECAEEAREHCSKGSELVTWLQSFVEANDRMEEQRDSRRKPSIPVPRRNVTGMWQVLLEDGVVFHVDQEEMFEDSDHYYRFHDDVISWQKDSKLCSVTDHVKDIYLCNNNTEYLSNGHKGLSEKIYRCVESNDVSDALSYLQKNYHDAMVRKALRQEPQKRSSKELQMIYNEILHIKALAHLSDSVKRELAGVLKFEFHYEEGKTLFKQGDEGTSWFIILRGTVKVDIFGKGVVCTMGEGDDFGNLALVNDAPRSATIVLAEDNCHFMRVDKLDFIAILKDVEANTVRLKEHGEDVLILEKMVAAANCHTQSRSDVQHEMNFDLPTSPKRLRYSIKAGMPERILEHILDHLQPWKIDCYDEVVEDFILMHITFMKTETLWEYLLRRYRSEKSFDCPFDKSIKRKIVYFVVRWSHISTYLRHKDEGMEIFLKKLEEEIELDSVNNSSYSKLKEEFSNLYKEEENPEDKMLLMVNGGVKRYDFGGQQVTEQRAIKSYDKVLMKIYNSEKSYTTLRIPVASTAEDILDIMAEKLSKPRDVIRLVEVTESGDTYEVRKRQSSVATAIALNSYLCVCSEEETCTPVKMELQISDAMTSQAEAVSSLEIAYHVTQYDWKLVNNVHVMEYVYKVFGAHKFSRATSNLDLLTRRFNQLAYWAPTEICSCSNVGKRAQLLRKFIKIAQHLKMYQNMNAFLAVMIGIGNQAVSRLTATWEKLPARYKKMVQEFEAILDPSRNHRAYRLAVSSMEPPIIPYLPLLLKDMTFLHEGNNNVTNHLVNFEKMKMFSNSVRTIVRGCSGKLDGDQILGSTKTADDTKRYVENIQVITNQKTLNDLSAKLEPKR